MKVFILFAVVCIGSVLCVPETPAAPYAPSGWRPKGPAFELPSRSLEPEDSYRSPKEEQQTIEVTEEEVQYTGELGTTESAFLTTPFLEYGPPDGSNDDESSTPVPEADTEGLSVQGLPSSEPAKEFRALPSERLKDGRAQKLRAQQRQKTARLQAPRQLVQSNQFQRQQVTSFTGFQAPNQFGVGVVQTGQRNGKTFGQSVSQFGQLTLPRNNGLRPVAVFQPALFQRQELAADPINAPVQTYGSPANQYGPPVQTFGPPAEEPLEEGDVDQPEAPQSEPEVPQLEEDNTTETNDEGDVVAISNAVSSGKYTQSRQGKAARLRAGGPPAKLRTANLRQFNEPIYTFNQFGQLVRIY